MLRFLLISLMVMGSSISIGDASANGVDELRSAVAVSQLILAQQAQFFKELINITKARSNCVDGRDALDPQDLTPHAATSKPPTRLQITGSAGPVECPYPYVKVVDECFYVSKTGLAWHPARHHCQGMGGDLATPSNLYALKTHIVESRGPRSIWVGGIDYGINGGWQWVSGASVETEDWSTNRPNANKPTENCLSVRRDLHPALTNLPCHKAQHFACQYRL